MHQYAHRPAGAAPGSPDRHKMKEHGRRGCAEASGYVPAARPSPERVLRSVILMRSRHCLIAAAFDPSRIYEVPV